MFIESLSTDLHFRHLILFKSTVSSGLKCLHGIWMHCVFFSGLCILPHDPQPLKSSIINIDVAESLTRWDHVSSIMPGLAALSHVGLNCFSFSLSLFPIFTGDENSHKNHSSEHHRFFNLCYSHLYLNQAPNPLNNSNSVRKHSCPTWTQRASSLVVVLFTRTTDFSEGLKQWRADLYMSSYTSRDNVTNQQQH